MVFGFKYDALIVYIFFPRGNKILVFFGITIILSFSLIAYE